MEKIDKLKSQLVKTSGQERINLLNEISALYTKFNLTETLKYAEEALKLSKSSNFLEGKANSLNNLSIYYFFESKFAISESYIKEAVIIAEESVTSSRTGGMNS